MKPQVAPTHRRRVGGHKLAGNARQQDGLQRPQIPLLRDDEVKDVVQVKRAILEDDMSRALDVWNQELLACGQRRGDAVDGAVSIRGSLLGDVSTRDGFSMPFEVGFELRIDRKVGKLAIVLERVDHTQSCPLDGTTRNVLRGG